MPLRDGYRAFLIGVYDECRNWDGWETIYELHDEEDRQFFWLLDEMTGRE